MMLNMRVQWKLIITDNHENKRFIISWNMHNAKCKHKINFAKGIIPVRSRLLRDANGTRTGWVRRCDARDAENRLSLYVQRTAIRCEREYARARDKFNEIVCWLRIHHHLSKQ